MSEQARLQRWREAAALHGERVNLAMNAGKQRLGVHRLTWTTLFAAFLVVWRVPQIGALIPFPPHSDTEAALSAIAALTAGAYFVLWLCIFPVHAIPKRLLENQANESWLARRTRWLDEHFGRRVDAFLERFGQSRNRTLFLMACLAVLIMASWATPLAIHVGLLSIWLLIRSRLDPVFSWSSVAAPDDARDAARKLFDRGITIVLFTNAGGELLWKAQRYLPGDLPYRAYSVWATLQTIFAIVLAVSACDALSVLGLPWIRTKAVTLLALVLVLSSGGEPVGTCITATAGLASHASAQGGRDDRAWIDQLLDRIHEIPEDQPALLIAASGGGSRAALLASLVYEKLRLTPARVGAGEHARTLADNVLLLSSVSGGSLATAYFLKPPPASADVPAHAPDGHVDPARSDFVRSMATDFMAPLLRGVLNLKQERGASVASFWSERFAWNAVSNGAAREKNRPLAVFNATTVQSGTRVGIGFPALPRDFLRPALVPADIDGDLRIALSDAVRLSANFPYGFEYAVLTNRVPRTANGDPIDNQVIDGGVVDNTGLDTLALILDALRRQAASTTRDASSQLGGSPYQLALEELRKRGLVLIEIDAGARPSPPTWPATSFSSISKPVEAMGQADHRNASILRDHNIAHIRESLDEDESVPAVVGVVRAGFECTPNGDVITAWALDQAARAHIFADFRAVEDRFATSLALQLEAIAQLRDARRVALLDASGTSPAIASASELRLLYEAYLEQAMTVDAIEHANARDCGARERETMSRPTESALRERVDNADRTALAMAPEPAQAEAAAPAAAEPAAEPAAANAGASPAPTAQRSAAAKSVLGWIYLGNISSGTWQTKYTNWSAKQPPKPGQTVELVGTSYVRVSPPDKRGRLSQIRIALKPRTNLEILETRDWSDTGLIWARVSTPDLPAVQRANSGAAAD